MVTAVCSYVMDSPALSNQRGINFGRVYMQVLLAVPLLLFCKAYGTFDSFYFRLQDGTLAVSVAQEALIRLNE